MKKILKPMLAMGVIVMSLLITAVSCDKKPAAGNNSGNNPNNNSGNSFSGRTGDLSLAVVSDASSFVKIKNNTVYISATGLANKTIPLSRANEVDRSFNDLLVANEAAGSGISYVENLFNVVYHGSKAAMVFVNRAHVTKDTIALRADDACTGDGEKNDNDRAKAAGGGICRLYYTDNTLILFYNELGTVFDNTKTTSRARGMMQCLSLLGKWDSVNGKRLTLADTSKFNVANVATCKIGVVNNGLGTRVEINNSWVTDSGSTTEVELYALAVDVTGKSISEFSSAAGFNRFEFAKALDNAAFKKILEKNYWADLRFKVKIVNSYRFTSL